MRNSNKVDIFMCKQTPMPTHSRWKPNINRLQEEKKIGGLYLNQRLAYNSIEYPWGLYKLLQHWKLLMPVTRRLLGHREERLHRRQGTVGIMITDQTGLFCTEHKVITQGLTWKCVCLFQ